MLNHKVNKTLLKISISVSATFINIADFFKGGGTNKIYTPKLKMDNFYFSTYFWSSNLLYTRFQDQ